MSITRLTYDERHLAVHLPRPGHARLPEARLLRLRALQLLRQRPLCAPSVLYELSMNGQRESSLIYSAGAKFLDHTNTCGRKISDAATQYDAAPPTLTG